MNIPELPSRSDATAQGRALGQDFIDQNIEMFDGLFEDLPDPQYDLDGFKREFSNRMNDFQAKLNLDQGTPIESFGRTFDIPEEVIKWAVKLEQLLGSFAPAVVGYIDKEVQRAYTERLPDAPPMLVAEPDNPLAGLIAMLGEKVTSQNPDDIRERMRRLEANQDKPVELSEDDIQSWLDDIPETNEPSED